MCRWCVLCWKFTKCSLCFTWSIFEKEPFGLQDGFNEYFFILYIVVCFQNHCIPTEHNIILIKVRTALHYSHSDSIDHAMSVRLSYCTWIAQQVAVKSSGKFESQGKGRKIVYEILEKFIVLKFLA